MTAPLKLIAIASFTAAGIAPAAIAGEPVAGCPAPYELAGIAPDRPVATMIDTKGNQDGWVCFKPHPGNVDGKAGNAIDNNVQAP